jgi:hypothetical protein
LGQAQEGRDKVGVLSGRGDGNFEVAETFATGEGPAGIVVGKFDHSKKVDLAVAMPSRQRGGAVYPF